MATGGYGHFAIVGMGSAVDVAAQQPHARIGGYITLADGNGPVGGGVVRHDQLQVGMRLRQDRLDSRRDEPFRVERGHADADARYGAMCGGSRCL